MAARYSPFGVTSVSSASTATPFFLAKPIAAPWPADFGGPMTSSSRSACRTGSPEERRLTQVFDGWGFWDYGYTASGKLATVAAPLAKYLGASREDFVKPEKKAAKPAKPAKKAAVKKAVKKAAPKKAASIRRPAAS